MRFIPALLILAATSGCSSHAYDAEARLYADATTAIFIASGLCSTINDCAAKELVKWEAGGYSLGPIRGGGVQINVYQVTSAGIWARLTGEFRSVHSRLPKHTVTLTAYPGPHGAPGSPTNKLIIQ